jgi:hypothetical protein
MAVENIGNLVPTKIPSLIDDANIQDALKAYHYGSYDFDTEETDPAELLNPSIAYTINDLQGQIDDQVALELAARDISRVSTTAPTAAAFTAFSETIPDGYVWLDKDSSAGVGYYSATSIYTATAPTTNLANGVIWIEKGSSPLTMYVWNADTSNWDEIGA